jgi:hypothetical protein
MSLASVGERVGDAADAGAVRIGSVRSPAPLVDTVSPITFARCAASACNSGRAAIDAIQRPADFVPRNRERGTVAN